MKRISDKQQRQYSNIVVNNKTGPLAVVTLQTIYLGKLTLLAVNLGKLNFSSVIHFP